MFLVITELDFRSVFFFSPTSDFIEAASPNQGQYPAIQADWSTFASKTGQ